jgi:hypothetical protein
MSAKTLLSCLSLIALFLLPACGNNKATTAPIAHPATDRVETIFQQTQVPDACRVIAQVLVTVPALQTGRQFAETVTAEARARGAEMLLIGQSRQSVEESELSFAYYPPAREFRINEWPGWNFGAEEWKEQGAWANIGFAEWGNNEIRYDYPVVLQAVFLRCRP